MKYNKTGSKNSATEAVFRLMRNLRRRPSSTPHRSRGYNRLLNLVCENDSASSRELAELMDIRPSSLTELLVNLEDDGMIRRNRDEKDHRVVRVFLEEAGRKHLEKMKQHVKLEDDFSDILTAEESDLLISLCTKLSDGLEKRLQESGHDPHHKHMGKHERHHGRRKGSHSHRFDRPNTQSEDE